MILDDTVNIEVRSKEFGRIATQNAKNVILQKIREEERKVLFDEYYSKERDVVTGVVQRYIGKNVSINLGKVDAILTEGEQIKGRSVQTYRAYQTLYFRSKIHFKRTKDLSVENTSGVGKASV